jgi:hypothetical protein
MEGERHMRRRRLDSCLIIPFKKGSRVHQKVVAECKKRNQNMKRRRWNGVKALYEADIYYLPVETQEDRRIVNHQLKRCNRKKIPVFAYEKEDKMNAKDFLTLFTSSQGTAC